MNPKTIPIKVQDTDENWHDMDIYMPDNLATMEERLAYIENQVEKWCEHNGLEYQDWDLPEQEIRANS